MVIDGIPPPSRNHRTPTGPDTPASAAAASLDSPRAIAAQNRTRCSRRPTGGRPGDRIAGRPARAGALLLPLIATPLAQALRRPIESALRAVIGMCHHAGSVLAAGGDGHAERVEYKLALEVVAHRPADDPTAEHVLDGGEKEEALSGLDVLEVADPEPVRLRAGEVAVDEVRRRVTL